ncbi:hypothetical protein CPAL_05620 [Clostridium thermopalmarium DSM 5974]|uniref:Uncharacterized protein n=1 Tax=Clostridium thermopalmarium DSM 5974 TaxID=1121340 RepID=A0A2T0AXW1_9CLOT|nr:hypothetical protein CPAL_05620 [Clostridium thermopalmarium DSM 5974]
MLTEGINPFNIPAGPLTNTTPVKTSNTTENTLINCLKPFPRYIPTTSGILAPSCLTDNIPEK